MYIWKAEIRKFNQNRSGTSGSSRFISTSYRTISMESGSSIFIYNRFHLNWSTENNEMMWLIFIKIHFVWLNKNAVTSIHHSFWHILSKRWIRRFVSDAQFHYHLLVPCSTHHTFQSVISAANTIVWFNLKFT